MGKNKFVSVRVLKAFVKMNFVDLEIFTLLRHCAAYCGNSVPTFRDKPLSHLRRSINRNVDLTLKKKTLRSFEMLVATHSKTQRYISEYFNLKFEEITGYTESAKKMYTHFNRWYLCIVFEVELNYHYNM
jgi:hypothetical protein